MTATNKKYRTIEIKSGLLRLKTRFAFSKHWVVALIRRAKITEIKRFLVKATSVNSDNTSIIAAKIDAPENFKNGL